MMFDLKTRRQRPPRASLSGGNIGQAVQADCDLTRCPARGSTLSGTGSISAYSTAQPTSEIHVNIHLFVLKLLGFD